MQMTKNAFVFFEFCVQELSSLRGDRILGLILDTGYVDGDSKYGTC